MPDKAQFDEAHKHLEQYRRDFEAGRRGVLMDALATCARARLPMPAWLSDEYLRIYDAVITGRDVDWNEELGFRLTDPRVRNRRYIVATRAAEVGNAILREHRAGSALGVPLYKRIAGELNLPLRRVRECWDACRADAARYGLEIEDVGEFTGLIRPVL